MSIRTRCLFTLLTLGALGATGCDNSDVVADQLGTAGAGGSSGSTSAGNAGQAVAGSDSVGGMSAGSSGSTSGAGSSGNGDAGSGGAGADGGTSAGDAGMGDTGGSESPTQNCDDANPCTADSFSAGICHHAAVPEGQRCEDGDLCTLGDRCVSGACSAGPRQTGAAAPLGTLNTYGTSLLVNSGNVGLVVTPGDDRFLFVDQPQFVPQLTQTRVVDGVLQTLDSLVVSALRSADPPVATAWDNLAAVAADSGSVQVGGDPRLLQIVSISPAGKLTARGTAPLGGDAITSMLGHAQQLFVCTNFSFFTTPVGTLHWIDVTNPDAPVEITSGSLGSQCGSLAVSEDGKRLYVNTANGVRFTDLSAWSSGALTFATDPIVSTSAGLALRGNTLLARTSDQIHLLDEATHVELSSFTVPGAHAAGFTDAGIFVQGDRALGAGREYFIALYTQAGALLQERILANYAYNRDITSAKPAVSARYVTDTVDDRIFDVSGGSFHPISEPRVGSLYHLFAGRDAVHARGLYNAQRIDVTDPSKPSIVAGGPDGDPAIGIKLDESLSPAALIPEFDPTSIHPPYDFVEVRALAGHTNATTIQRFTVDANERHVAAGSIQLPGGDAQLLAAGDYVYRIVKISGNQHVQRWLTSDLRAGVAAPALDLDLGVPTAAFAVDPNARMAVAANGSSVQWIDLSVDPPAITVTPVSSGPNDNLKVRGHRLVGSIDGSNIGFMELGSSDVQVVNDAAYHGAYVEDILAFDGNVAYLSVDVPGTPDLVGSAALQIVKRGAPAEQALVSEVRMPGLPTALVAMDSSLVVGSASQLVTLAPHCQ